MALYTKKIYFAGGDFHELQAVFANQRGVTETRTGYINAEGEADFAAVATGKVKARMGVEVAFDPKKTDISTLLDILFAAVNPYVPDGQGKARGEMYRAGVFYTSAEDEPQIELYLNFIATRGKPPTGGACTEIIVNDPNSDQRRTRKLCATAERLKNFQAAEEEHQDYLKKHPETETFLNLAVE
ncbi:MAG: peptide-methionine (S)-S-oxide reductase [Selenomonadaceae bacterium]|nr:peptide-methionine (S)-S-oxide reductase [Selenomonadaceae bacterium]